MNDAEKLVKSNQEQAVAAWASHLNQVRLDTLLASIAQQDVNLEDALVSIDVAMQRIGLDVINLNLGGQKGMHGFIAEVAEVGVGNAREQILGKAAPYLWVNDNGPVDLLRDGVAIQQKFVDDGGYFGLRAISKHLEKYPDYVRSGGKYQIPSDHFEVVRSLHDMTPEDASTLLSRSGDGPSYNAWQRVQEFFAEGSIDIESLEPSKLEYAEVQRGAYEATLDKEKDSLRTTHDSAREKARHESRPGLQEGLKVTAVAAVVESGTTFIMAVAAKRREGKKFQEFTSDDWQEIAGETGFGAVKGAVRGSSIYSLTNFTATSAAAASAIVTAAFGVAEQANRLRRGEIDELEFIENAELVSLEAAVSALSSFLGQALIPVPVLGAVIGNTIGTVMYRAVSTSLSSREAALIEKYLEEQRLLDERLASEFQELIDELDAGMASYVDVLERAFSPNVRVALVGSVELALALGVPADEILDSEEKASAYFVD